MGYVFQDFALLPELTAIESVMLPLLMLGFDKSKAFEQSKEALEKVDLHNNLDQLPGQLSGGQQQRVSIARAIVNSPKILFADEPTASLDSQSAIKIIKLFKKLNELGQTIVMVSHEQEYYSKADRVVFLSDGMLIKKSKK